MFTTIEADIENGVVKSSDLKCIPDRAHVLITVLDHSVPHKPNWQVIKQQIGKIAIREETSQWQRRIRSEWE